jgi:hypothetical protein
VKERERVVAGVGLVGEDDGVTLRGPSCTQVALSLLQRSIFAVFAVQMDDAILYEPEDLLALLTRNNTVPVHTHHPSHIY